MSFAGSLSFSLNLPGSGWWLAASLVVSPEHPGWRLTRFRRLWFRGLELSAHSWELCPPAPPPSEVFPPDTAGSCTGGWGGICCSARCCPDTGHACCRPFSLTGRARAVQACPFQCPHRGMRTPAHLLRCSSAPSSVHGHFIYFFFKIFWVWTIFWSLYWICDNIASVLCFGFLAARHVGA